MKTFLSREIIVAEIIEINPKEGGYFTIIPD